MLGTLSYHSFLFSLSPDPLAIARDHHSVLCLAQTGDLLLPRGMQAASACQMLALPLAGGLGCGGNPFLTARLSLHSVLWGTRSILWALVQPLRLQMDSAVPA